MLKECNLFRNSEPMEWWLNRVRANCIEEEIIKDHKKFIDEINGDINDFENISVENVLNGYEFEKSRLFELLNDCRIDSYDYELLLHKRATIHIKELFNHYVDDETLVVISSFQHISAEREIEKCKHIIRLDEEDEHSNFIYNIDKVIDEGKKYKKVFVYIPGKALARSDKAPLLGMKSVLFSDVIQDKKNRLTKAKIYWIDAPDKIGKIIYETMKG